MADLWDNPMRTDGFEFVEYTGPEPAQLAALFERMGFVAAARHRSKNVTLYRQGDVNFIVNAEPESFAQSFARIHGPSVCAIAFRVKDAARAYRRAVDLGAWGVQGKTGLKSKAMTSPCGKIRIPINESADDRSQIAEYLAAYRGEGIQHIALASSDIHESVEA